MKVYDIENITREFRKLGCVEYNSSIVRTVDAIKAAGYDIVCDDRPDDYKVVVFRNAKIGQSLDSIGGKTKWVCLNRKEKDAWRAKYELAEAKKFNESTAQLKADKNVVTYRLDHMRVGDVSWKDLNETNREVWRGKYADSVGIIRVHQRCERCSQVIASRDLVTAEKGKHYHWDCDNTRRHEEVRETIIWRNAHLLERNGPNHFITHWDTLSSYEKDLWTDDCRWDQERKAKLIATAVDTAIQEGQLRGQPAAQNSTPYTEPGHTWLTEGTTERTPQYQLDQLRDRVNNLFERLKDKGIL